MRAPGVRVTLGVALGLSLGVGACRDDSRPTVIAAQPIGPIVSESDPLVIDVGTALHADLLGPGWSGDEKSADGREYRWNDGPSSELVFTYLRPATCDARLTLVGHAFELTAPLEVAVELDGVGLGAFTLGAEWASPTIVVPVARLREGPHRLRLRYARTARPSEVLPGNLDRRALAAAFDEIRLEPVAMDAVDLGTARGRPRLVGGWGDDGLDGTRTVTAVADRAELSVVLEPDQGPYVVEVVARAERRQPSVVLVNGAATGEVEIQLEWRRLASLIDAAALRPGANRIALDVAAPALVDRIRLAPAPSRVAIDLGTPEARGELGRGWSDDEPQGERTTVWSDGTPSTVTTLMRPAAATAYLLVLDTIAVPASTILEAQVTINGRAAGTIAISSDEWQQVSLAIPDGALRTGVNEVQLAWSRLVRPSDVDPTSDDQRKLAARVDRIWIVPAPPPP